MGNTKMKNDFVYINLFNGGSNPKDQNIKDGWGFLGPTLGPFNYASFDVDRICVETSDKECVTLFVIDDCAYYDGKYYGNWRVTGYASAITEKINRELCMVQQLRFKDLVAGDKFKVYGISAIYLCVTGDRKNCLNSMNTENALLFHTNEDAFVTRVLD